jgi:hypothetical protein
MSWEGVDWNGEKLRNMLLGDFGGIEEEKL